MFEYPYDEELNEALRGLPGRWFNWRHKHWRVPADPRLARSVETVLARFPALDAEPQVLAWLDDSGSWRALATAVVHEGSGVFMLRTLSGEAPGRPRGSGQGERTTGCACPSTLRSARLLLNP